MKLQQLLSYTRRAVDDYHMIEDGDKIAVGISGGKDSLTMLYALSHLKIFYPKKFELEAVTIDLGFGNLNLEPVDVSTAEGANDAIDRIDVAIQRLSEIRGRLGAYQNRLESTINSLDITTENMTAAYSRIMDVDMAEEMSQYTTAQVLTQAGTSMLAQANERPSQVLQLLQ